MDSADLRFFEAVARLGGMNRAAADLHTVQSNVTARIRQLEEELQLPLFERGSRGVALTAAGRRLLPHANKVLDALDAAKRAARDDGVPKGPLVIGSLETTAAVRLSPSLTAYAAAYPSVDITLRTGTTVELVREVLEYRVEGAFVCGPVNHVELDEQVIFREELVVLTPPGAGRFEQIAKQANLRIVVLRLGCSYRQRLEEALARRGSVGLRVLEFGTLEAILNCVAAGLGITMLPRSLVGPVLEDGRVAVHGIARDEAMVETTFIMRRDSYVSSALTAFLDCVRPSRDKSRAAE